MTVEKRLRDALSGFGDPVANGVYRGEKDRYYTFNATTQPADFADDAPQHEKYLIQVHFYAPLTFNLVGRRKMTKLALHSAGFLWPECTDASDEKSRHLVFETQYADGCDLDGDDED